MERFNFPRSACRYDYAPVRPVTFTPISHGQQRALSPGIRSPSFVFPSPNHFPSTWPYQQQFTTTEQPIIEEAYSSDAYKVESEHGVSEDCGDTAEDGANEEFLSQVPNVIPISKDDSSDGSFYDVSYSGSEIGTPFDLYSLSPPHQASSTGARHNLDEDMLFEVSATLHGIKIEKDTKPEVAATRDYDADFAAKAEQCGIQIGHNVKMRNGRTDDEKLTKSTKVMNSNDSFDERAKKLGIVVTTPPRRGNSRKQLDASELNMHTSSVLLKDASKSCSQGKECENFIASSCKLKKVVVKQEVLENESQVTGKDSEDGNGEYYASMLDRLNKIKLEPTYSRGKVSVIHRNESVVVIECGTQLKVDKSDASTNTCGPEVKGIKKEAEDEDGPEVKDGAVQVHYVASDASTNTSRSEVKETGENTDSVIHVVTSEACTNTLGREIKDEAVQVRVAASDSSTNTCELESGVTKKKTKYVQTRVLTSVACTNTCVTENKVTEKCGKDDAVQVQVLTSDASTNTVELNNTCELKIEETRDAVNKYKKAIEQLEDEIAWCEETKNRAQAKLLQLEKSYNSVQFEVVYLKKKLAEACKSNYQLSVKELSHQVELCQLMRALFITHHTFNTSESIRISEKELSDFEVQVQSKIGYTRQQYENICERMKTEKNPEYRINMTVPEQPDVMKKLISLGVRKDDDVPMVTSQESGTNRGPPGLGNLQEQVGLPSCVNHASVSTNPVFRLPSVTSLTKQGNVASHPMCAEVRSILPQVPVLRFGTPAMSGVVFKTFSPLENVVHKYGLLNQTPQFRGHPVTQQTTLPVESLQQNVLSAPRTLTSQITMESRLPASFSKLHQAVLFQQQQQQQPSQPVVVPKVTPRNELKTSGDSQQTPIPPLMSIQPFLPIQPGGGSHQIPIEPKMPRCQPKSVAEPNQKLTQPSQPYGQSKSVGNSSTHVQSSLSGAVPSSVKNKVNPSKTNSEVTSVKSNDLPASLPSIPSGISHTHTSVGKTDVRLPDSISQLNKNANNNNRTAIRKLPRKLKSPSEIKERNVDNNSKVLSEKATEEDEWTVQMSRKKKKKLALVNMQSEHKSLPIASKPTAHQDRPPRFLRKPKAEAPNPPQSGCFAKLLEKLKVKFPSATAEELSPYIKKVRQSHGGSMCGLHMATIIQEVTHLMSSAEVRRRSRMPGSGITNQIKPNNVEYREEECPICIGSLREQKTRTLDCGHVFHDQCICKWVLQKDRICPICRRLTLLPEEFPALC